MDYASGQDRKGWWKVQKFGRVPQDCPKHLPKASKSTSWHLDLFLKPLSTQKLEIHFFVCNRGDTTQTKKTTQYGNTDCGVFKRGIQN